MHYLSEDQLLAVGAFQLYSEAYVFTGKLYDQAFTQRRNGGSSSGGFASGECNGKTVSCTIVPRCMGSGRWSSTTIWKVNGKRISQKQLMEAVCKVL